MWEIKPDQRKCHYCGMPCSIKHCECTDQCIDEFSMAELYCEDEDCDDPICNMSEEEFIAFSEEDENE